jgi:hypothetical protein
MTQIASSSYSVGIDAAEWRKLGNICSGSRDIHAYAQACRDGLWTDGQDQTSWCLIKQGAEAALGQADHDALVTILTSYLNITDPSHNGDQWRSLSATAHDLLARIGTDPSAS